MPYTSIPLPAGTITFDGLDAASSAIAACKDPVQLGCASGGYRVVGTATTTFVNNVRGCRIRLEPLRSSAGGGTCLVGQGGFPENVNAAVAYFGGVDGLEVRASASGGKIATVVGGLCSGKYTVSSGTVLGIRAGSVAASGPAAACEFSGKPS